MVRSDTTPASHYLCQAMVGARPERGGAGCACWADSRWCKASHTLSPDSQAEKLRHRTQRGLDIIQLFVTQGDLQSEKHEVSWSPSPSHAAQLSLGTQGLWEVGRG